MSVRVAQEGQQASEMCISTSSDGRNRVFSRRCGVAVYAVRTVLSGTDGERKPRSARPPCEYPGPQVRQILRCRPVRDCPPVVKISSIGKAEVERFHQSLQPKNAREIDRHFVAGERSKAG